MLYAFENILKKTKMAQFKETTLEPINPKKLFFLIFGVFHHSSTPLLDSKNWKNEINKTNI